MASRAPKLFKIANDDYSAQYCGKTGDGRLFFLTTPFVPDFPPAQQPGREFIALYTFEKSGALLEAVIDDLGPRATVDEPARLSRRDELLRGLGPHKLCPIRIAPFKVHRFGVDFGFIAQPPEDQDEDWSVIAEPGNYMCFWPPWTSGDYDT